MTNGEKYKTSHERAEAFNRFCQSFTNCNGCKLACKGAFDSFRYFAWLELEAEEEKRRRRNRTAWLYRQKNYQKCLERERKSYRKRREKINHKNPYVPALSRRIPWYADHARHLAKIAEERRMEATVSFATAVQSGLTIGRFSK